MSPSWDLANVSLMITLVFWGGRSQKKSTIFIIPFKGTYYQYDLLMLITIDAELDHLAEVVFVWFLHNTDTPFIFIVFTLYCLEGGPSVQLTLEEWVLCLLCASVSHLCNWG